MLPLNEGVARSGATTYQFAYFDSNKWNTIPLNSGQNLGYQKSQPFTALTPLTLPLATSGFSLHFTYVRSFFLTANELCGKIIVRHKSNNSQKTVCIFITFGKNACFFPHTVFSGLDLCRSKEAMRFSCVASAAHFFTF